MPAPTARNSVWSSRLVTLTLLGVSALAGCEKPIFTPDEPRSQYDRLDTVRNAREPSYIPDEFGNLRPNLTGRLTGAR